jgi:glutamate-ammonia-ligase adenylyltransferase
VLDAFAGLIEPVVWRESLADEVVREIRSIKARVENERIPLDEDPDFHLKLGPGGLSDVEFVTQLLQLRHGHGQPELRQTGTFHALAALRDHDIITTDDFNALHDSYLFCTRVRLRLHLQLGGKGDSLPRDPASLSHLAASLGFERSSELREQYRRHTRRARRTFERLFYG